MTYFIIFCTLLLFIGSSYAYQIAFFSPKRGKGENYHLPQGEQYDEHLDNIQKWIDEMRSVCYIIIKNRKTGGRENG